MPSPSSETISYIRLKESALLAYSVRAFSPKNSVMAFWYMRQLSRMRCSSMR